MKNIFKACTAMLVCSGSLAWSSSVLADGYPTSVAGTWSAVGNQTTGSLVITQPSSTLNCRPISGTIFAETIEGFYCPSSGNIGFARLRNNVPIQYYEGNLSQTGTVLRIGGKFSVWTSSTGGGSIGEYSFSATK